MSSTGLTMAEDTYSTVGAEMTLYSTQDATNCKKKEKEIMTTKIIIKYLI